MPELDMDKVIADNADNPGQVIKAKGGRPKGSKNKGKASNRQVADVVNEDKKLADMAKAAQSRRRKVPLSDMGGPEPIVQKELINRVAEEYGDKQNGDYHYTFLEADRDRTHATLGYELCKSGGDRLVVGDSKDVMWRIPMDIYTKELEARAKRCDRRLRSSIQQPTPVSPDGVQIEEHAPGSPEAAEAWRAAKGA